MSNLYLWFSDATERRNFVLGLLDISHPGSDNMPPDLLTSLQLLETGKTTSPYYRLCDQFYMGIVPETECLDVLWAPATVFKKGFRRIYTLNRHNKIPGCWLVVQLRYNEEARERRRWINSNFPNAPIPDSRHPDVSVKPKESRTETETIKKKARTSPEQMKRRYASMASDMQMARAMLLDDKLDEIAEVLKGYLAGNRPSSPMTMDDIFNVLNSLKDTSPEIFSGERVYLWEQLGWIYNDVGHLARMEYCLRMQASFQPGCADAFLNLGCFWSDRGLFDRAVAAYQEGLQVNPKDEYIYHNLAELFRTNGKREAALAYLNSAIVENPDRGINHKLKGDIHFEWGEYAPAILAYTHALECFEREGWSSFTTECLLRMSTAETMLGKLDDALATLTTAVSLDPISAMVHLQLATLYAKELGRWPEAAEYAQTALELDPLSPQACFLLAEYYQHHANDPAKAKWYFKRGKQLESNMIPS